jgi:acetylornithine deacetylase
MAGIDRHRPGSYPVLYATRRKNLVNAATTAIADRPKLVGLDLIRTLIAFDTTSRDSNLALIDWVRDYLAGHGIDSQMTFDDDRRKANLFATLPALDGNATRGGIVLSGHTDVVPVDGQPWDTDPFEATQIGERLYGRGTSDMKSFSAIGLAFVPEFLRRGLKRPLHFSLSYDEEVGCIGVRRLIADVSARDIRPAGCIVGEPTGMHLVVAHKGKKSYRCRVRGHEAHSSLTPRGANAVQVACEVVTFLTHMARRFRDRGSFDAAYDVPYTTVHTGVIRGGTALNIVPRDCSFEFEFRHLPFDDPDALLAEVKRFAATLLPEMHAVSPATHIEFDALSVMPGFDTHGGSEIAEIGKACSGTHDFGKVSFGTEAALFHNADISTIICGPGHIEQAHQPNEWVSFEQLARCEAFMARLADRVCAV